VYEAVAPTADDPLHDGVLVLPVQRLELDKQGQQAATDFRGREVCAEQDCAPARPQRVFQIFQAIDADELAQSALAAPPAHAHLQQGDPHGSKIVHQQLLTCRCTELGKTQFDVDLCDMPPACRKPVHQVPDQPAGC
jgi:hypothetical protein